LLHQLRGEYTGKRNALMKGWTSAKDSRSKAKARANIPKWHASLRPQSRIAMAQLQQAMKRDSDPTKKVHGVSFNKQTQFIAERDRVLYP